MTKQSYVKWVCHWQSIKIGWFSERYFIILYSSNEDIEKGEYNNNNNNKCQKITLKNMLSI